MHKKEKWNFWHLDVHIRAKRGQNRSQNHDGNVFTKWWFQQLLKAKPRCERYENKSKCQSKNQPTNEKVLTIVHCWKWKFWRATPRRERFTYIWVYGKQREIRPTQGKESWLQDIFTGNMFTFIKQYCTVWTLHKSHFILTLCNMHTASGGLDLWVSEYEIVELLS
jgi:hypothetical protein